MKAPLDNYQKVAMGLMSLMVLLTFALTNVQALLWQASDTLVSAVLPSVVVDLTNEERDDVAAPPLRRNPTLDKAANLKAQHMAENSYFAHFAPDGTSPWYWFDEAGYVYAHAGENLAIHFSDSAEVVEAWMDSPLHRANIVDKKFTEIGVGTARGFYNGQRTVYVVQLFGTPAVTSPVAARPSAPVVAPETVATIPPTQTPDPVPVELATVAAAEIDLETSAPDLAPVEEVAATDVPEAPVTAEAPLVPTPTSDAAPAAEPTDLAPPIAAPAPEVTLPVVTESMLTTSSGLPAASVEDFLVDQSMSFMALATQPNTTMQVVYTLIALAVFVLLILSFVNELRHAHPVQMGYSVALLLLMTGLYWLHTELTAGAIVV